MLSPQAFKFATWFGYAMSGYQAFLWLFAPHWWTVTARLRGHFPLREAGRTLTFVAQSPIAYYLYQPGLLYLAPLAMYWFDGTVFPFSVLLFPALFQTYIWAYQSLPPTVLLLASSRQESFDFRYTLERALNPYRVVCLLPPGLADPSQQSLFKRNLYEWDNFWSVDSNRWRTIADPLMEIASFIVVDARVATPGVTEEAGRIVRGRLLRKTLFIVGESRAVLDANGLAVGQLGIRTVHQEQVVAALKALGLSHTASPDDVWRARP